MGFTQKKKKKKKKNQEVNKLRGLCESNITNQ